MRYNFPPSLAAVFREEGVDSDHPADPGGRTRYGITERVALDWGLDVRTLMREDAERIYRDAYWNVLECDELPPGLDLMVFDAAVNQGPRASAKLLQRAVGAKVDGIVGLATIRLAKGAANAIDEMGARRMRRYARSPRFLIFGLGWSRRLMRIHSASVLMAQVTETGF